MSGQVLDIPGYSVPAQALEPRKPGQRAAPAAGAGGRAVATFTVDELRQGVSIGTVGGDRATGGSGPPGLRLDRGTASQLAEISGQMASATPGHRYRVLDNGRLADIGERVRGMSEEQKLSKLKQIRESAEEYEGFLIAEMIKNMRQSPFAKTPGSDTYSEIAEKPFTAALTQAGGLGLAQTIVNQVASQEGLDGVLAEHPEAMGPHWRQRLSPSQMPKPGPKAWAPEKTQEPTAAD